MLNLEQIQIEEKISFDQSQEELIIEKMGEIKLSGSATGTGSKEEVGEEIDVLVHETDISAAVIPAQERKEGSIKENGGSPC